MESPGRNEKLSVCPEVMHGMSLSSAGTFLRIQVCGRPKLWVVRAGNRELRVVPSWPPEMAEGPAGNDSGLNQSLAGSGRTEEGAGCGDVSVPL